MHGPLNVRFAVISYLVASCYKYFNLKYQHSSVGNRCGGLNTATGGLAVNGKPQASRRERTIVNCNVGCTMDQMESKLNPTYSTATLAA
jgi:hypothetical protein